MHEDFQNFRLSDKNQQLKKKKNAPLKKRKSVSAQMN